MRWFWAVIALAGLVAIGLGGAVCALTAARPVPATCAFFAIVLVGAILLAVVIKVEFADVGSEAKVHETASRV